MSTAAPSITLAFGSVFPPQADVVELTVHLGCSKEVGSYEAKLHNYDGRYSPTGAYPITVGLDGSISLGRGGTCPLLMTVRVEDVNYESSPTENYVTISGRCWGERLFRRTVTKTYSSQKGEAIVKDLMDYYAGLSHTRSGAETVEATDTTFTTLDYTDSPVWDILKYVAESSDKSGVIGFDFRVAPDGKFEFFPKLSKTNATTIVDNIDGDVKYRKNITRIRNKITIYGLADKSVPTDKVSWTRSLTPSDGTWGSLSGTVSADPYGAPDGGACIKLDVTGALYYGACILNLNAPSAVNCEIYPLLDFLAKLEDSYSGTGNIILFDTSDRTASKKISVSPDVDWHTTEVGVGSTYANQWDEIAAGFDWTHVWRIRFDFWFAESVGAGDFWLHSLYFGGRRYSAAVEDSASQAAYGLREYVETDEELWSDNECDLRADSLLAYLKDPAEYLTLKSTLLDYGSSPILAGDKVHVHLPVEGVDCDFRVESVEYHVPSDDTVLEVTLELGKEAPQLADYLYGLRTFTVNVEKLSRTKLGKRGVPVSTAGSGGSGSSVFASNVEIDKYNPVLNLLSNRVLKAAFGFDTDNGNAHLVSYIGDLIFSAYSRLIRPFQNDYTDLGSASFAWRNIYVKRLCSVGSLDVANSSVITAARVLQNVTADAALIASGKFGLARFPEGTAGYVLEAEGAGFDPMYVNPNNRYAPASHNQSADSIDSGGTTLDVVVGDGAGGTKTLHFANSKFTGAT